MMQHFVRRISSQVALRQTLQERFYFLTCSRGQNVQAGNFLVIEIGARVKPLVHVAIELIRGGNVKLPNVLRFPCSQRVGTNRLDVGVGEEAKHLQPLWSFYFLGKGSDGRRIENIAAECG